MQVLLPIINHTSTSNQTHAPQARASPTKNKYLWDNDSTLTFSFMGGNSYQRRKVSLALQDYIPFVSLQFKEVARDGIIRISFDPHDGTWSYVGKQCLEQDPHLATMNLGFIDSSEHLLGEQDTSVILHEIGHVLGFLHENLPATSGVPCRDNEVCTPVYFSPVGLTARIERTESNQPNYTKDEYPQDNIQIVTFSLIGGNAIQREKIALALREQNSQAKLDFKEVETAGDVCINIVDASTLSSIAPENPRSRLVNIESIDPINPELTEAEREAILHAVLKLSPKSQTLATSTSRASGRRLVKAYCYLPQHNSPFESGIHNDPQPFTRSPAQSLSTVSLESNNSNDFSIPEVTRAFLKLTYPSEDIQVLALAHDLDIAGVTGYRRDEILNATCADEIRSLFRRWHVEQRFFNNEI